MAFFIAALTLYTAFFIINSQGVNAMANKILILYKSKTGFTRRYAEMISEEINCTLMDFNEATAHALSDYDTVVFGTRLFAGTIDGLNKAKEMFDTGKAKRFVLFVTGATPNDMTDIIDKIWEKNLSESEEIPHFYMQSGLNYGNMSLGDKTMIKIAAAVLKRKKPKDAFEAGFAEATAGSYDISSREYIMPLVEYLKKTD